MKKYALALFWLISLLTYFGTRIAVVGKTKVYQLEYPIPTVAEGGCLGREVKHTGKPMGIVSVSTIS